jgi:hypothetical protein
MNPFFSLGKVLIIIGLVIAGIGILLLLSPKVPWIGKLPGDILIKKDNFRFYFPLATCIIVSNPCQDTRTKTLARFLRSLELSPRVASHSTGQAEITEIISPWLPRRSIYDHANALFVLSIYTATAGWQS